MGKQNDERSPYDNPFDSQETSEYVDHPHEDDVPPQNFSKEDVTPSGKATREDRKAAKDRALRDNACHLYTDMRKLAGLLDNALFGKDDITDKAHTAARALKSEILGLNNRPLGGYFESSKDAEIYLKKCKKILYKHQSDIMSAPETWNQIKSRFAAFMNRYFNAGMSPEVKQSGFISQKQELKTTFFKAKGYGEKIPKHKTSGLSEESEQKPDLERQPK